MTLRRLPATLAVLGVTTLLLAGCDAIAERAVEEVAEQAGGGDGEVDINTDDGSMSIETDEGSFTVGSQELPEELPDELPLPDGLSVMGSTTQNNSDGLTIGMQTQSEASFDELEAFFTSELESAGWTINENTTSDMSGLRSAVWQIEGFGFTGQVAVTQLGEDADSINGVSVTLQEQTDAG